MMHSTKYCHNLKNRLNLLAQIRRLSANSKSTNASNENGGLWSKYNQLLESHPLLTKGITAGGIALFADITSQVYFPTKGSEDMKKAPMERINWARTRNFVFIQSIIVAPLLHYWYGFLSVKIIGDTFLAAIKRVAFDQLLFAPCLMVLLFGTNMALEQGNLERLPEKLKADLVSTTLANYVVWVPAQIINFKFVPPPLRVLTSNFVGFFWNIYLSMAMNLPQTETSDSAATNKDGK